MNNEESLSSMSKIGIAESPETNHYNKRNSNGRFSKLRKGGHIEKSLHPLRKGLAARRSLVKCGVMKMNPLQNGKQEVKRYSTR